MTIRIRKVTNDDWEQVNFIYEAGIATKISTFETHAFVTFEKRLIKD